MVGTVIYALASVGAALSTSVGWLALFRAISAFGGAAGTVIPRAVVRDLATGHAAAVMMSQLTLVLGVAPILAPSLGGAILIYGSWRWIFWVLAGYALLCCVLCGSSCRTHCRRTAASNSAWATNCAAIMPSCTSASS